MSALASVFETCHAENRAALVTYLPCGYPSKDGGRAIVAGMVGSGADIVEIGVAYSDPVMDGPVIQRAADDALRGGVRVHDVFGYAEAVAAAGGAPVVMSYWNPILKYGVEAFARDLAAAGGQGIITPNLIPEEAQDWIAAADRYGLDKIFLVAPSSTTERLSMTAEASSGFLYVASTMGVTGARDTVDNVAPELVARVREVSDIPVGVGLGVRSREQAAEIAAYADAVIAGSALVSAAAESIDAVKRLTAELAAGVRDRS
ncbi:Tryptophan synthase alpha chain OS=Tsukamurella paurometabola (strain ATCC 8368 / DSM / CCUG 35730 / CIP 100753 / JCM 10117 / KCTC 9821 / NBRC 16120 / NCIMB 702349 / NCTC 13040) OX=521096 GN=trpA PE=3 SV=1 [Tsukamurella paurometabola]|uniref:Tryptophan synthase alpha chain n=1 Tax=Tsukamurella paurometabola (strain ATCC 8368 / DSM 20162 / CCUG 35730 / CIP 100753 / JCM 10117 / KCTC 9821 / NBRC 16120 / NCIMB 702349 / NCTC 13040) TaxID=521096 RepID=D5UNU9_TSUPD|nr:tryptophan synthase subunit alpha [Tsukamurella paurometabola]ADG78667.1 tryptophan synthase, alpha subunit [Tsukamurella paurometabola DSM 20162]SUP32645.1 Tryptophan synthase alpha chain [Tsukamurella paurometabola]